MLHDLLNTGAAAAEKWRENCRQLSAGMQNRAAREGANPAAVRAARAGFDAGIKGAQGVAAAMMEAAADLDATAGILLDTARDLIKTTGTGDDQTSPATVPELARRVEDLAVTAVDMYETERSRRQRESEALESAAREIREAQEATEAAKMQTATARGEAREAADTVERLLTIQAKTQGTAELDTDTTAAAAAQVQELPAANVSDFQLFDLSGEPSFDDVTPATAAAELTTDTRAAADPAAEWQDDADDNPPEPDTDAEETAAASEAETTTPEPTPEPEPASDTTPDPPRNSEKLDPVAAALAAAAEFLDGLD